MLSQRKLAVCTVSVLIISFAQIAQAKSLYAITEHSGTTLTAYGIQGDQIDYQTDTQIDTAAVGLALDPDSGTLFATYDGAEKNRSRGCQVDGTVEISTYNRRAVWHCL